MVVGGVYGCPPLHKTKACELAHGSDMSYYLLVNMLLCWLHSRHVVGSAQLQRERERDLREETVYCSPAWDCGKGSLV